MDRLYNKWLQEGDLRMLLYLWKNQQNIEGLEAEGKKQAYANLIAQMDAVLDLQYNGKYRYLGPTQDARKTVKGVEGVEGVDMTDQQAIASFLRNKLGTEIKPRPVEDFPTHPLWILWEKMHNDALSTSIYHTALWLYRRVFFLYMSDKDYDNAAAVLIHAQHIKIRNEPLPILHPYVIRKVMYCNLSPLHRT